MATLGLFDPEVRQEALFDATVIEVGRFDPELIDTGAGGPQTATAAPSIRLALESLGPFPTTALLDDFNRANENPLSGGGAWTTSLWWGAAGLELASNRIRIPSGTSAGSYRGLTSYGPDVEEYCTVAVAPTVAADILELDLIRAGSASMAAPDAYIWPIEGDGLWAVYRADAGVTGAPLANGSGLTLGVGDGVGVRYHAATATFSGWHRSGASGIWTKIFDVVDVTYAGPWLLELGLGTNIEVDDFSGGQRALLGPTALLIANAQAPPSIRLSLAPNASATLRAQATPSILLSLAPVALKVAVATAVPSITLSLAAAALKIAPATASPSILLALAPSAFWVARAQASPSITLSLAPTASAILGATASPSITLSLAPSALVIAQATASPGITLSLAAAVDTGGAVSTATAAPSILLTFAPNIVTDSFNRADDASSLGTADSGQVWNPLVGTWGISGNKAVILASGATYNHAVVESGTADAVIQVTIDFSAEPTAIFGVAFRTQSAGNGLIVRFRPSASQVALYRLTGGAVNLILGASSAPPSTTVVRVECSGTAVRCYIDGVLGLDAADVTDYLTETKHGLLSQVASAVTWDNFSVSALRPMAVVSQPATATPSITLSLAPVALSPATATPSILLSLAPSALVIALATASPSITLSLAPNASATLRAQATPSITLALAPVALKVAPATATPSIKLALAPAGTRLGVTTAAPSITLSLAPAGLRLGLATATPSIRLTLAASVSAQATASPSILLTLGPATAAIVVFATTAPTIILLLQPTGQTVSTATIYTVSTTGNEQGLREEAISYRGVTLMSRRMYFSTSAGAVTITPHATWLGSIAAAVTKYSGVTKQNTALANTTDVPPGSLTGGYRWMSFLTDPLRSDFSFVSEYAVSMVIRASEVDPAEDAHLAFILRVMQGDTSTQRGVLASFLGPSSEFIPIAATKIHTAIAFANVSALAGDRLCLEIGMWGVTPAGFDTVTFRFGDPTGTADFALTSGLTTDLDPWWEITADVEFTTDPIFATTSPSITLALSPAGVGVYTSTATPSITLSLAPAASATLGTTASPSIRLSIFSAVNPLAQATPSIRLTLGPATTLGTVAAAATPHIVLGLTPAAFQASVASAAPRIRVAITVAHAIGGFILAGGSVVEMEYNATGSTVTGDQRIAFGESGVSTITLSARE